jgi:hypothetical protein
MRKQELEHLAQIKTDLSARYRRKAAACKSRPLQAAYLRHAERFRRQAENYQREVNS